jgi:hypothetical protein
MPDRAVIESQRHGIGTIRTAMNLHRRGVNRKKRGIEGPVVICTKHQTIGLGHSNLPTMKLACHTDRLGL